MMGVLVEEGRLWPRHVPSSIGLSFAVSHDQNVGLEYLTSYSLPMFLVVAVGSLRH